MNDLSEQINALSIIFETTHMLVAYLDTELKFIKVNRAYAAADQKQAEFFVGKKHFDLYPNQENEQIFRRVIETGEPHFSYAKPFGYEHNPERGVTYWDWSLMPSRDAAGAVTGVVLQLVDVTERIKAERALRHQEALLESFFSHSLDGCFFMMIDEPIEWSENADKEQLLDFVFENQRLTQINDVMLVQYGATSEVFLKLTPNDFFSHNLEYGKQLWRDLFDNGRLAIKTSEQRLDGTPMWIEGEYVCLYDEKGRITGHFGIQREITAKKKLEDEILANQARLNEAQKLARVGSWELDLRTNHLWWTDEIFNLFELEKANFGASYEAFLEAIHPDDRGMVNAAYTQSLKDRAPYAITHRLQMADGRIKWVEERCSTDFDEDGTPLISRGTVQDITERKLDNAELESSRARFKAMFESMTDAVILTDTSRRITIVNQAVTEMFGYSEAELLGNYTKLLYGNQDHFLAAGVLRNSIDVKSGVGPYRIEYRRKDGSIFWGETHGKNIQSDDHEVTGFVAIIRDVTQRIQVETELASYRHQLEQLVEERTQALRDAQAELIRKERLATLGQLTATVSHELRNPLGAMRPSLYIIKKDSDPSNVRIQSALDRLDRNISRCDHIIDELLDFTRITTINAHDVEVDDWLRSLLSEQIIPPGISLRQELALDGLRLRMDVNRMRRALINVIENGCHSMLDETTKTVSVDRAELIVFTRQVGETIEIGIRDTGVGISEDILPHIFEPLYSTKGFGVGLGMPTVKQIVEQHGGSIHVNTQTGLGTTVVLSIPNNKSGQAATGI